MSKLQIVIKFADFYVLNADENCQMRWQKKELLLLIEGSGSTNYLQLLIPVIIT